MGYLPSVYCQLGHWVQELPSVYCQPGHWVGDLPSVYCQPGHWLPSVYCQPGHWVGDLPSVYCQPGHWIYHLCIVNLCRWDVVRIRYLPSVYCQLGHWVQELPSVYCQPGHWLPSVYCQPGHWIYHLCIVNLMRYLPSVYCQPGHWIYHLCIVNLCRWDCRWDVVRIYHLCIVNLCRWDVVSVEGMQDLPSVYCQLGHWIYHLCIVNLMRYLPSVYCQPGHWIYHLCIVNLCRWDCRRDVVSFGISRVIKSLEPYNKKLGTDTWYYAKRCFLSLIENMSKHMIMMRDAFLECCEMYGREPLEAEPMHPGKNTVTYEARLLKGLLLQLI
ncbi:hypothetical protein DPMN_030246 [Dreissena polymorpha]|uniref:Tetratricopeptide repeat protein 30 n=1 Tax=Dreissena polymorpha TaxID=45954 RepID=A0A9D4RFZ7_DREPO|nr:hypothetical protein DPMN_030246 [Dreissena polymorpha]